MSNIIVANFTPSSTSDQCDYSAFGFNTVLPVSSEVGANEDPLYPFSNCYAFQDNLKYSPLLESGTVSIELSQGGITSIDYLGIAIHNGGSAGLSGTFEYWNGSQWIQVFEFSGLKDDKPFMSIFDPVLTQKQRLTLTFSSKLFIGSIYVGKAVVGMSTPSLGFQPGKFSSIDEVETFTTDGNNTIMGRRIDRGFDTKGSFDFVRFDYLDEWFETYMNWVLDSKPMFFKWSSLKDETFYGRQVPDRLTKPTYSTSFHATIRFEMTGYA